MWRRNRNMSSEEFEIELAKFASGIRDHATAFLDYLGEKHASSGEFPELESKEFKRALNRLCRFFRMPIPKDNLHQHQNHNQVLI